MSKHIRQHNKLKSGIRPPRWGGRLITPEEIDKGLVYFYSKPHRTAPAKRKFSEGPSWVDLGGSWE